MGASYNPRTGTYARGAAAYGPYGSRAAGQAYNPRTGTYAQTRQGSNVYGNWGTSSVQRGDNWAQTAHGENYRRGTSTAGIRTDSGAGADQPHGTRRQPHDRRSDAGRRRLRRARRQHLPARRGRRLGAGQRSRRLEPRRRGWRRPAARPRQSVGHDQNGSGRSAGERPHVARPGQSARDRSGQLAEQWTDPFRCGQLWWRRPRARRRWPPPLATVEHLESLHFI